LLGKAALGSVNYRGRVRADIADHMGIGKEAENDREKEKDIARRHERQPDTVCNY
jgi:hypothetical protein